MSRSRLIGIMLMLGWWCEMAAAQQSILQSKHNLSVSGPGAVHALNEERVCIFCHTPHGGRDVAPLWNRRDSSAGYTPYDSPSLKASVGQPTGASKLCLCCHDGTIALGDLVNETGRIAMAGGDTLAGDGLIGTDLRDDHPISFSYSESRSRLGNALTAPATWTPKMKLDHAGELQCTTCHDPHDDQWGKFLVMSNQNAALCQQCHHMPVFNQTPHATSARGWNGAGQNPWPHTEFTDVQTNACMNCHRTHHANGQVQLQPFSKEEDNCFICHNGSVAQANLQSVFNKPYSHPVNATQGVHREGENPQTAGDHVECADCHNPHIAHAQDAEAPMVPGVLEGVSGIDLSGSPLNEALYEYQICFKCHGRDGASGPINTITRQINTFNTRLEFAPAAPSYHPVAAAGRNSDVPSLISPLTPASIIYCGDCHGNDGATQSNGLKGPHGSSQPYMLSREYRTGDPVTESPTAYALCYKCHNRNSILNDESFPLHRLHVDVEHTACSTCHDGHGIDLGRGNPQANAHLINFDTSVVSAANGVLEYRSLGQRSGQCTLNCHGVQHEPLSY